MASRSEPAGGAAPPWRGPPRQAMGATAPPANPRAATVHCVHCDVESTRFRPTESRRPAREHCTPEGQENYDRICEVCEADFGKADWGFMAPEERDSKGRD